MMVGAWHLFGNVRGFWSEGAAVVFVVEANYTLPFGLTLSPGEWSIRRG